MARYIISAEVKPRVCRCGIVIYETPFNEDDATRTLTLDCEGDGCKRPGKILKGFGREHVCKAVA